MLLFHAGCLGWTVVERKVMSEATMLLVCVLSLLSTMLCLPAWPVACQQGQIFLSVP